MGRQRREMVFLYSGCLCGVDRKQRPYSILEEVKTKTETRRNETVTNCHGLKLRAADGKLRLTDVADTEQLFRLIQSVPSPQ